MRYRVDMGEIKPVDNGVNMMSTAASDEETLWFHIAPDPQGHYVKIAVSGAFNGRKIERSFSFSEREILKSGRTAMDLVRDRLAAELTWAGTGYPLT